MNDNWNRREFLQRGGAGVAGAWLVTRRLGAQPAGLQASGSVSSRFGSLGNSVVSGRWEVGTQGLRLLEVRSAALATLGPMPVVRLEAGGQAVDSTQLRITEPLRLQALDPSPAAACLAERLSGWQLTATLADPRGAYQLHWRALLRDGSHYIRQEIRLTAGAGDVPITAVVLLDVQAAGARVEGTVAGSPVTITPSGASTGLAYGGWFLGFEHPLSHSSVENGRARCQFARALPLAANHSAVYSSVIGAAAPGQMRRDFLRYLERERAHPYRPFLHYNSWFDLGYFTPYDQYGCLDRIHAFGEQLYRRRSVPLDSFLFDDGWDNHKDWGFNAGFPEGFTPLTAATAAIGNGPGVWLSPWGGYGPPRRERLDAGKALGYEENQYGLALSGPVYYRRFHEVCLAMVTRYGVNQFKLDGTGSNARVVPGSQFGSDFEAAIQLIADMRQARPDLFVNLTTGTYPSPFWLRYADSTWRGGYDTNFAGAGSDRQQWITYRDAETYHNVVGRGPLYPLNSLMLHGIVYASHARRLDHDDGNDFAAGVRSYFGTGTQLQEMYITHYLLTDNNWDVLAEAALWARRNAATLVDSHWVGGDPRHREPYGHAAWSRGNALLVLRNPSDKPQALRLDPAEVFELPATAASHYRLRPAWRDDQWGKPMNPAPVELEAGTAHEFQLQPFEVLTLGVI
ncbi:MAG: enterotoxin [Terriglobales bacterium]